MTRLFFAHAAISLIPVVVLGAVLAFNYKDEARRRGLAEGRSEAALVGHTAVEPLLDPRGTLLAKPVTVGADVPGIDTSGLRKLVERAVGPHGDALRLRLRDVDGRVVFSADNSPIDDTPEDEAVDAARTGEPVATLTHLNSDANDMGPAGPAAVEVYQPLYRADPRSVVGVLEIYLPYAQISEDVNVGLHNLYRNLGVCLGALYLALFAIAFSVSRGLRKEAKFNVFLAEHDNLTDLPNRTLFHRRAAEAVKAAGRSKEPVAIAIIDLDRFKDVNDTLGHQNGDRLLAELARRLDVNTRPEDTVARLGGDEFGVVLRGVTNAEEALWRVREIMDREIEIGGLPLSVEASIGFVVAPEDGTDVDDLLQRADVAMYVAKSRHVGVVRYDPDHDDYDASKLGLIAELRQAIDAGQLVLHYQPKAAIRGGQIEAVEALVRWQHPARGLLYPDTFLPFAEQTDLIDKLTEWVLATALEDLRDLDALDPKLSVAVNVSARSLSRADFASRVEAALASADVAPTRLIVEITETALVTDPRRAATVLAQLDDAGVRVSIDDFGKGQTSLGYLSALPVHELKIDKSFVCDMLENPAHAAIVRSIVDLGHNLSMRVIAEGVETEEVLASLRETDCDVVQGYLLARPMAWKKLEKWLKERTAKRGLRRRPLTGKRRTPVS